QRLLQFGAIYRFAVGSGAPAIRFIDGIPGCLFLRTTRRDRHVAPYSGIEPPLPEIRRLTRAPESACCNGGADVLGLSLGCRRIDSGYPANCWNQSGLR